jgi:hypothetical protein
MLRSSVWLLLPNPGVAAVLTNLMGKASLDRQGIDAGVVVRAPTQMWMKRRSECRFPYYK